MKTLIIPDIHNKINRADAILEQERQFDRVVFLGDIFDSFGDTPEIAGESAKWVKEKMKDNRFIFLWGNHDISYRFDNDLAFCPGSSVEKYQAIREILNDKDFDTWNFFRIEQGFLLSHAGLHPKFLPPIWQEKDLTTENLKKYLVEESEICRKKLSSSYEQHWFYLVGDARRRPPKGIDVGGLLWCDARSEFEPVPGLSQVFGHTPSRAFPVIIYGDTGLGRINSETCLAKSIDVKDHWNVALDCHLEFYAVIEDGKLQIKRSPVFNF